MNDKVKLGITPREKIILFKVVLLLSESQTIGHAAKTLNRTHWQIASMIKKWAPELCGKKTYKLRQDAAIKWVQENRQKAGKSQCVYYVAKWRSECARPTLGKQYCSQHHIATAPK